MPTEIHFVMPRPGQSGSRSAYAWLARALLISCVLAQLFGPAFSAATPCAAMTMTAGVAGEVSMHDDHGPSGMQAAGSVDCCDGGVCSIAECATPVGACSTEPFVPVATLLPQVFSLTLQHPSAETRRLFRPPIAA